MRLRNLLAAAILAVFLAAAATFAIGSSTARAQSSESSSKSASTETTSTQSAADRIESELGKTTAVDFVESPLKDVVGYLMEHHGIPIVLCVKKLEEASISPDTPITKSLRGIQLRSALNLILKDLELTYVVRDEVLQITTPEDAESQLVIRVYDCRDLLAMPEPHVPTRAKSEEEQPSQSATKPSGAADSRPREPTTSRIAGWITGNDSSTQKRAPQTELERRTDQLIDVVTTSVMPDSWDDVGGPGSICAYNGLFTISQTDNAHRQAEHLLNMLRKAAGIEVAKGARVIR